MRTATRSRSARLRRLQDEELLNEQFIRLPTVNDDANDDGILIGRWNRTDTEELMAAGHGRAAKFNGSTQWLSRAGDDVQFSTGDVNFALAGWFYLDSLPGVGTQQILVEKWVTGAGTREWTLVCDNTGGTVTFRLAVREADDTDTVSAIATTFGTPVVRTWYFIYGYHSADSNVVGIRVNLLAADESLIAGGVQDTTSPLIVGSRGGASFWLPGRVGPWGWWKTTLPTAAVLTELYNSGSGRLYADLSADAKSGLVEWYDMQERSGNRAGSVAGLTLTDNGSTLFGHGPTRSGLPGLVFSGGRSVDTGDPALVRPWPIRRQSGRAIEARVQSRATNTTGPHLVASSVLAYAAAANREHGLALSSSAVLTAIRGATTFSAPYAYSANTDVWLLIVEDATGAHYYASTDKINWTLLFVDPVGSTSALYAVLYTYDAAGQVQPARVYRRRVKPPLVNVAGPFGVTTAAGGTLVTNGNMEAGGDPPSNWTAIDGSVLSAVADDAGGGVQCLSQTRAAGAAVSRQTVTHNNNVWLRAVSWIKRVSTGGRLRYYNNSFTLLIDKLQATAAWTQVTATTQATTANGYVYLTNDGGAGTAERYDNVDLYALTWSSTFGATAYTTPAANASLRFKVPTCTANTQAGMAFKRVDDDNCLLAFWDRNDGKFYVRQRLAGAFTNSASATLAYDATAEVQCVWNGSDLRVHVGSTAIGAGLTIHADLLAATAATVWATDDDSRIGPLTIEGGLP